MAPIAPAARAAPVPVAPVSAHRSRREDGIAHASNAASVSAAAPRTMPDIAIGIAAIANSAPSAGRHSAAAAPSMARAAQASARGSTPAAVVERLFEPAAGAASPTGSSSSTNGTNDTSMRRVSAENDPHDASSDVSESPLGQPSITSTVPSRTLQQQPPAPAQAGIASNMAHPYGTENALNNLSLRLSAQGLHFHPVNRQGSLFRAVAEHVHHNQHMYKAAMHECTQFANVHCQEYLSMPASMNLPRNPADFHSSVRLLGKQSATFVQAHGGRDGTDGLAPQTFEFQLLADTFQRPVMVYSIQQPAAGASGLRLQSYTPQLMRQSAARSLSDDPGPPIRLACLDRQWFVPVFVTTTTCEQPSAAQHGESLPTTGRPSARKSVRISEKTAHDLERERQQDELAASIASQIRETFSRGEEKLYNGPQDRPDIALIECGCASVDEFHASAATQGTPLNSTSTNTGTGTANPGAPATSRSNFTPQSRFLQLEQYTVPAQSSADSNSENDMDMNSSSSSSSSSSSISFDSLDAHSRTASLGSFDMTDRYAASSAKADPVVDDVDIRAIWQPSAAAAKAAASAAIAAAIAAATAATAAATRDHQEQYDQRLETSGSEAFNSDLARRLMQHGSFSPRLGRSSANATSHSTHAPMHINQPQHAQSNPPHFSTASQRVTQLASERKAASADSSIDDDEFQQIQEALELSLLEQHDYVLSHASLGHATQEAEATDSCTSLTSGNIQPCNAKLSGNGTGRAVRWSVDEPFVDPPLDAYDEDSALQLAIAMSIQECSHHADAGDDVGMQDAISAHDQGRSRMEPHQTAGYGEGHAQASQQQGQLAQDPLAPLDEEALREQRRRAKGKQRAE